MGRIRKIKQVSLNQVAHTSVFWPFVSIVAEFPKLILMMYHILF